MSILSCFIEWKDKQSVVIRGNVVMYDVKPHYKFLQENELFDFWVKNINNSQVAEW